MTDFSRPSVEMLGFAAATLTTTAFVPQLVRVLRLRSARDISLGTFLMFSVGVLLWFVYGILSGSKPVLVSNGITLLLSVSILGLKLWYGHSNAGEGKER
ncbi:MAG: SemiSWEET transporter [Acidobacteriota bacterium]|nr:SemiSWEET transporter [Acidobacteriota bacterium]